jgi:hypothetical protein
MLMLEADKEAGWGEGRLGGDGMGRRRRRRRQ